MQRDPVKEIAKRTERYWFEDGIWEIGFGLVNAFLGAFYLLVASQDWEGPLAILLLLIQIGVIVGSFLIINRLVKYLKERITYPRTGYVAYQRPTRKTRWQRALRSALLAAGIGLLISVVSSLRSMTNQVPLVSSIVMAGALVYLGYRFGLLRLYFTALLTVLLGYFISTRDLTSTMSTAAYFGSFGLLVLGSGLITLLLYLRRTQVSTDLDMTDNENIHSDV